MINLDSDRAQVGVTQPDHAATGPLPEHRLPNVPHSTSRVDVRIADLEATIQQLQDQSDRERRRRRRNLLLLGASLSVLIHLGLMIYLDFIHRARPAGPAVQPVSIEFAVIQESELTQLQELQFDDLVPEVPFEIEDTAEQDPALDLAPEISAAELEIAQAGSVPRLTGSGSGEGLTLEGGGAGTTFFGVSSRGTRFAYIVDISGSMSDQGKIEVCMRELARSIEVLPDYASFFVVLFNSEITAPPMQKGWTRARDGTVKRFTRWLEQVDPGGGTRPQPAFRQVFSLENRPDVIFFLTDGVIPRETVAVVAALNGRGRRVAVNTIAFGDPASQAFLKEISHRSGGVYRYVSSDGF